MKGENMKSYWSYMILFIVLFGIGYYLNNKNDFKVGGLYSVINDADTYSIAKVLVIDKSAIHIRVYKNKFKTRPDKMDASTLLLGTIHDKDGFGIGHLPLNIKEFKQWDPQFIQQEKVNDEELEGYKMWKEANGGVFGNK